MGGITAGAGITFTHVNADRVEIAVDGQPFGSAITDEWGGWNVFQGAFPHATRLRQADGCTLDEVLRHLRGTEVPEDFCDCCHYAPCACQYAIDQGAA